MEIVWQPPSDCETAPVCSNLALPGFEITVVVVVLLFYVNSKHLTSYRDGQLS